MRVLFIRSNSVNPDSRVEKEVLSLRKHDIDVDVFCWERESNHNIEKSIKKLDSYDIDIYRIGIKSVYGAGFKKNLIPLLKFQKYILKFIKTHKDEYDIIHACDFDTAFTSHKLAKRYGIKFVYDIFDYYVDAFNVPGLLRGIVKGFDERIMNKSDAIIICSEERRNQIGKIKQKNILVIHNSPASVNMQKNDLILKELGLKNENNTAVVNIAYIGILNDSRLIPEILHAISKNPDFHLYIAGFGKYEADVKSFSDKYQNIHFFGRISYDKTLAIESYCDILLAIYDPAVPNHKYAAPNKFYESLMLGKPLMMVKNTGMSQYITDNNLGGIIDYSEVSFINGINELNKRRSEWASIGIRGKELYKENFSWETMEARLINLYKNL